MDSHVEGRIKDIFYNHMRNKLKCSVALLGALFVRKNEETTLKNGKLCEKDDTLASKDQQIAQLKADIVSKDELLEELAKSKDNVIAHKNDKITSKDEEISKKDEAIARKDKEIGSQNNELQDKTNALVKKDETLASKDQHIAGIVKAAIESKQEMRSKQKLLEDLTEQKNQIIVSKDEEIAKMHDVLASKDQLISSLKTDLESPQRLLESFIAKKNNEVFSLKSKLKHYQPIIDTVDLTTGDDSERASKRPRVGYGAKSSLAIQHESNQKLVQVKQEKQAAVASLKTAHDEKQAVEGDLEEVRGDLGDANELVEQQVLATNIWQGRFDELAAMVEAGQVDGAVIAAIRNRSLASGS